MNSTLDPDLTTAQQSTSFPTAVSAEPRLIAKISRNPPGSKYTWDPCLYMAYERSHDVDERIKHRLFDQNTSTFNFFIWVFANGSTC